MKDLKVSWSLGKPKTVVGPVWKMVDLPERNDEHTYVKMSPRLTMRNPRQSGHEIEGTIVLKGKRYSAFTSGGTNPDGGRGMIILRAERTGRR